MLLLPLSKGRIEEGLNPALLYLSVLSTRHLSLTKERTILKKTYDENKN